MALRCSLPTRLGYTQRVRASVGHALIVVRRERWMRVVEEVVRAERRIDGLELEGSLAEVEAVREIVGERVRISQRWQVEGLLDKFQETAEIIIDMRNVSRLGIG